MTDSAHLRAWWFQKQGLDGSLRGNTPASILEKTGWARTVGGANPYLTLFARGGISREAVDVAVANLQICELPSARGCTYVVPSSDFALALRVGQGFGDESEIRNAVKFLGVTEKEVERLMERIEKTLQKTPLDPRQLKESLGDAVRNLGEAGKKRGMTTTLPLALGRLQSHGRIRRIPSNGRLDQQRYSYMLWSPSPLDKKSLNAEQALVELARRFFRWIGPASLKEFQWFSGLSLKACKAAVDPLRLQSIESDSELLLLPDERDSYRSYRAPKKPQYQLVSNLDGILHLRRDLSALLEPKDAQRKVMTEKSMQPLGGLNDLSGQAILDRGRLIGLWDFDPSANRIVWNSFVTPDKELKAAVAETEEFIREDLGDVRSFILDTPESRAPRLSALRSS